MMRHRNYFQAQFLSKHALLYEGEPHEILHPGCRGKIFICSENSSGAHSPSCTERTGSAFLEGKAAGASG